MAKDELPPNALELSGLPPKSRRIGLVASWLIRALSVTYRFRLHDPGDVCANPPEKPMVWIFWHNRIFVLPVVYKKFLSARKGAILSSASKDGAIIASIVARFGCASIRGSSSRRGAAALLGLIDWIKGGYDVAIVPDGPRGPIYHMGPGVIKLAEVTRAAILPVRIEYNSAWKFKSWDRFQLPKPFTTVNVYFEPLEMVPEELNEEAFEAERKRIETVLNPNHETD